MNNRAKLYMICGHICSAAAIIVTVWHLVELAISLEKLHIKLDTIAYCVSKDLFN